jgi:putative (di)nucleoside polyphosphate hydrolase
MTDWIDEDGYRANVGIVLMRDDGRVFLGGRTGGRGWQFPQGGIRPDEAFEAALYRELEEEIGLAAVDVDLLGETRGWMRYTLPRQYVRRNGLQRCIGQKQRWALLRFRGDEQRLRFDATDEPPEFDRFRWADFWDPVREVIFFKRGVYQRALHELGRIAFPTGLPPYPEWWEAEVARGAADGGAEGGGSAPAAG